MVVFYHKGRWIASFSEKTPIFRLAQAADLWYNRCETGGGFTKKVFSLLLILALLAAGFSGLFSIQAAEKPVYAAFGDSIAAGYRLTPSDPAPEYLRYSRQESASSASLYVNLLAETYGLDVYNFAKDGQTSTGLVNLICSGDPALESAVASASLITISIGGNDLLNEWDNILALASYSQISYSLTGTWQLMTNDSLNAMIARLKANYARILDELHRRNPDATIYGQTLYNPYKYCPTYQFGSFAVGDLVNPYVTLFNNTLAEIAAEHPYFVLVRVSDEVNAHPESFYTDLDFHPTASGHAVIAAEYQKAISLPPAETTTVETTTETTPVETTTEFTTVETTTVETTTETTTVETTTETTTVETTTETTTVETTAETTTVESKTETTTESTVPTRIDQTVWTGTDEETTTADETTTVSETTAHTTATTARTEDTEKAEPDEPDGKTEKRWLYLIIAIAGFSLPIALLLKVYKKKK